jgi:tripartite-type tricarboxylate transporter receptor subunit TctC
MNKGFLLQLVGAAFLAATPASAVAQDNYPVRAIRIIVPLATGGGLAFTLPRLVADKLSERWGRPIIVESRAGAAGNIGAEAVARAEPDGDTLLPHRHRRLS